MRPALLLFVPLLLLSFNLNAQTELVAKWRKGEVRAYDCSLQERIYVERELTSEESYDYRSEVQVTEEDGDHYALRYTTYLPQDYETEFYSMWDLTDEIPIEVRTSIYGEIESVTNAPDCLSRMKGLWVSTLETIPNAEMIDEMWNQLFEDFENSDDRDLALVGDLQTMLGWHGYELAVGEEIEFEAYIPGFDMLDDFPADGKLKISKVTDKNIMHGVVDYDLDEREFIRVISDFVLDFAETLVGQDAPEGALDEITAELEKEFRSMRISRQVRFEMDLNTGWPLDIRDRTTTEFQGEKNITQTKIVYNDGEIH
jgi:hypothetical protein